MTSFKQITRFGVLAAISAVVAAAAAQSWAQTVKVDGSSTVFPITEAVAEDFQKSKKGAVKVTVGISGTGGGFKKFCRGETDVSNASRPILKAEMEDCKKAGIQYLEMPVAYDALTVVVNPKNNWIKSMTRGGAEEDLGACRAGQDHTLEPGQCGLAKSADQALRGGRGFRNVRLLHRGVTGKSKSSRGRFHGERRR